MSFNRRSNPLRYRSTAVQYTVRCGGGTFTPSALRNIFSVPSIGPKGNEQDHSQPPSNRRGMVNTAHMNAQLHTNQAAPSGRRGQDNKHIYTRGTAEETTPYLLPVQPYNLVSLPKIFNEGTQQHTSTQKTKLQQAKPNSSLQQPSDAGTATWNQRWQQVTTDLQWTGAQMILSHPDS